MNRTKCKKYLTKAYTHTIAQNKSITPENIEMEMKKVIEQENLEYIAYSKIAVYDMQNSANEMITLNDLLKEVDILPEVYTKMAAILRAKKI